MDTHQFCSKIWLICFFSIISAEYQPQYHTENLQTPQNPQPLILTHRQSQTHDGGFKYAFATNNGLQQGESIAPDGTRNGLYSYIDPHGQQITVRYTAGKDGFRILENPQQSAQNPSVSQIYQPKQQPIQQNNPPEGQFGPQIFYPNVENKFTLAYTPPLQNVQNPQSDRDTINNADNAIQQEPQYNDEPGKPHSFGNGYSFEISG